jgi:hypothetical protein
MQITNPLDTRNFDKFDADKSDAPDDETSGWDKDF